MTKAGICTIGDEILIGQIVDTNSSFIAQALNTLGIKVADMLSIGDSNEEIINSLSKELTNNDIVIVTGGLGPTKDDITKSALAQLSDSKGYYTDQTQLKIVHDILHSRGLDVLDINLKQAEVPDTCEVIPNRKGTAPIMVFRFPKEKFGHEAVLYSLPGVPFEALGALPEVLDDIKAHFPCSNITHKTIMTYGLPESALAKLIEQWEDALPADMHLAYLPNPLKGVRLRLSIYGSGSEDEEERLEAQIALLRPILGDYLYDESDSSLEAVIGAMLRMTGKSLSCAESCTGGMISHLITSVPGASNYFLGSVVSYDPSVKENILGVKPETIANAGIVSSAVAAEMAEGVRKVTGSTYSIATTGWADSYGDEHEPAGTVWIGISGPDGTITAKKQYKNDRKRNIERFAASALDELRKYILNNR